jgi:peptide/nickel transport system ATP-binding protein
MPYTLGLLGSIPRLDIGRGQPLTPIEGSPPSLVALPTGCPFRPRCPLAVDVCAEIEPALEPTSASGPNHVAACHRREDIEQHGWTSVDVFPSRAATTAPVTVADRARRPTVLDIQGLVKEFPLTKGAIMRRRIGTVHAVDGVSFDIREEETLGLVGESGCGKTTTILEILNLVRPQAGRIGVLGKDTAELTRSERFVIRRDLQVVFQDPMASLDPRLPIGEILAEPLKTHGVPPADRERRVEELLSIVGLQPEHANRYPQAFSGGQRQRIGIARALALEPKVLVLDEPVSALDVSVQAQVLNLMQDLQQQFGISYLLISHDLAVVNHLCDEVCVLHRGLVVERGVPQQLFAHAEHPYTQALLAAVPRAEPAAVP